MSTQRPQPELSAYFIREKRILKAADTAKYNARLKEIDLPDDYAIYGYEPSSGRKPAAYWVCKQGVGECPECHKPYLEDAIASVSESKLTHYCRVEIPHEGRKPTYEIHPATLYLRRIRWLCYKCYSEHKTYNARMQDDSKLVDKEDKKLTLQVKEHLGQQAMHMEINTLAEIFDISPHTVDKCFDKAVDKYDKERDWDNISTLGLYTITLNVQGQQADCCLCANVDTEKLIEFFPYEDTKAAEAFLSKLKNKQNIQRVFTSIDSAAFDFAKTNFPIEIIMVDRLDVRKRLLNGLETVKKGNDDSKNYPLLRRNWTLLDNDDEAIPTNSKDYILLKKVLDAFPRIGVAYWLKEAGMDIYRKLAGQCKLVNDWILSDKHNILPYEQLQQCMTQAKEPVVRFAEQYNGVDRSRYEKAILAAEKPLMNCAKSNEKSKSARWSRAASFKKIRARVLYGAAMMANYFAAQEPNEKSHEEYAIHMYDHFIGPKIGKMKIKDIRKSTILGLYNDLTRSNDIGKTMAINTLETIHNVLRQVLQVAVDDDYIRKNPTDGVLREVKQANNYERPKRKALTLEQQNAFVKFLKSKPLYYAWSILFAVLLGTGCRIAEFVGLRWCDIDWENNTISINHNLVYRKHTDGKCYFSVTTPKTSAGCRTIPMLKGVRRALEDEKIRQQELGIKCTTVIDGHTDFVFFNRFGQPHNPAAINREIDRLVLAYNAQEMEQAEEEDRTPVILPDFSCHQLRHTFCTRYCEIEPNIKVIQEVMGHKDIKTTMEIYAEAQKELKERSVQNISGKFDVY